MKRNADKSMQRKIESDVAAENRNKLVESRTNNSSIASSGIKSYELYKYFRET